MVIPCTQIGIHSVAFVVITVRTLQSIELMRQEVKCLFPPFPFCFFMDLKNDDVQPQSDHLVI